MLIFVLCQKATAQDSRIIFLENEQVYELISRMQHRGLLLELNPEKQPYYREETYNAIREIDTTQLSSSESVWLEMLKDHLGFTEAIEEDTHLAFSMYGGNEINNTERKNTFRPTSKDLHLWPFLGANASLGKSGFIVNANLRFDYYYDADPDGIDAVNRLYTRNENAYLGYASSFVQVYAGRFLNNWGKYGQTSALISDNPNSFDQINLNFKTRYFTLSTIFGTLDNVDGYGRFTGDTRYDPNAKKRFISLKRLDWRPNKDLIISYRESILYSGYRAIPEIKYIVPVNSFTFLADNTPRNDVINLLFGLGVWKRINRLTLKGELIFDDIIFNREGRGITERGTFSWVFNSTYALQEFPADLNLNVEIISYQSYNTDQSEGRYLYLGKGLATQFNDYVFTDFKADWYADKLLGGLRLSPYIGMLLQGEQTINQPFNSSYDDGTPYEFVLTGTVEETYRLGINAFYSANKYLWLKFDIGYNWIQNQYNVPDQTANRFAGMIEVGFRYNFEFIE